MSHIVGAGLRGAVAPVGCPAAIAGLTPTSANWSRGWCRITDW